GQAHAPKQRFHDSRYWSFVQKLANIFEEGVREGDFLPLPALKIAAMFIDANLSVVMQRLANKITGNIQEDVSLVTGVFFRGIGNRDNESKKSGCEN
ncbi:MAG: hypothetical protein RBS82_13080, partial [Syntrophales bacterium]|nr:hypothetical protein [Syntrophales bacterium]